MRLSKVDISENRLIWNGTDEELKTDIFNNAGTEKWKSFISITKTMRAGQIGNGFGIAWKLSYEHEKVDLSVSPFDDRKFVICERPAMTMKRVPKRGRGFLTFLGKFLNNLKYLLFQIYKS